MHEYSKTEYDKKKKVWYNFRTKNLDKDMTKEQKKFFSKTYETEKEASLAAKRRSDKHSSLRVQRKLKGYTNG